MAKYKLVENGVLDTDLGTYIPNDDANRHWQKYQEWLNDADVVNTPDPLYAPSIEEQKKSAKKDIDNAAGLKREQYITAVSGQEATYLMKYDEAVAYLADGAPDLLNYPHLTAEAFATSVTLPDLANSVIATRAAWYAVSAQIEGARMGGKAAVEAAKDSAGLKSALASALANLA